MNFSSRRHTRNGEEKKEEKDDSSTSGSVTSVGDNVYFFADVDVKTCHDLIVELAKMDAKEKDEPVKLHILSDGGDVYAALAVIGTIKTMRREVHSYINGFAASAGTMISVACDKRFMYENSYMLIHQVSSAFWGKYQEFNDEYENLVIMMRDIKKIYADETNINQTDLDSLLKHDLNWDHKKCLEVGLVDEVLGRKKKNRKRKRSEMEDEKEPEVSTIRRSKRTKLK